MTELPSSSPLDPGLDLDSWKAKLEQMRSICRLSENSLEGWSIRVRHSRKEPYQRLGRAFKQMLEHAGAEISTLDDLEHALKSSLKTSQLAAIDAFLMVGGTAGVSAEAMELSHEIGSDGGRISDRTFVTLPIDCSAGFIRKRLDHHGVAMHLYDSASADNGELCARVIGDIMGKKRQLDTLKSQWKPTIAIVTALPIEFRAMTSRLEDLDFDVKRKRDFLSDYAFGRLKARNGGYHEVVVVEAGVGNNISAVFTERLFRTFNIEDVLMVGIAGGIPRVAAKDDDVRLGDVVVSNRMGIVQYDMVKSRVTGEQAANSPMSPSRAWIGLAGKMLSDPSVMQSYNDLLHEAQKDGAYKRPTKPDVLKDDANNTIRRKKDPQRNTLRSIGFAGALGSANKVVKSHKVRESIRKKFGVIAVEMEGAGVADSAMSNGRPFFVVRGICDYANSLKNDNWHGYAAMAAAVFAAELIQRMPLMDKTDDQS